MPVVLADSLAVAVRAFFLSHKSLLTLPTQLLMCRGPRKPITAAFILRRVPRLLAPSRMDYREGLCRLVLLIRDKCLTRRGDRAVSDSQCRGFRLRGRCPGAC